MQTRKQRDAAALELRAEGYSYREIASVLRWNSVSSAHRAVARELAREPLESVPGVRRLESLKLDALERELWRSMRALEVDDAHRRARIASALLRCYERRARLHALDGEWIDWDAALKRAAADAGLTEPEVVSAAEELMRAHAALRAEEEDQAQQ